MNNNLPQAPDPRLVDTEHEGIFFIGMTGNTFVRIPDQEHIVDVPKHAQKSAFHKDKVRVRITDVNHTSGYVGEILEVLERSRQGYIGILKHLSDAWTVTPGDNYYSQEIFIAEADLGGAREGNRVFVTLTHWDTTPMGRITKILPDAPTHKEYGHEFALEQGFDTEFPEAVLDEAKKLASEPLPEPDSTRRDIRHLALTCTIDPEDAQDFDDALSWEEHTDGTATLGIHIADVAHYVRPNTPLDEEAQSRGTSVYLVGETVPMLPEVLSNNLCSLRPNEDKCTFSVLVKMNQKTGEILDTWYGRTLFRSHYRFTYEEAFERIQDGAGEYGPMLQKLNHIAEIYKNNRIESGALTLEKDEIRCVLDEKGEPIAMRLKTRNAAHFLIEEYMLLANRLVAEHLAKTMKKFPVVYRIHDRPDPERVAKLQQYLMMRGYRAPIEDGVIPPSYLRTLMEEAGSNSEVRDALSLAIARSMQKAIYSIDNVGHYGLGLIAYTHFTSPIRRYPDIMVHRLLAETIAHADGVETPTALAKHFDEYASICEHASGRERNAAEAERASLRHMQVAYLMHHQDEVYEGTITGFSRRGIFITERTTQADGLALFKTIGNDYYTYDMDNHQVVGERTGTIFNIGDVVPIEILNLDLEQRLVDYRITLYPAPEERPQRNYSNRDRRR